MRVGIDFTSAPSRRKPITCLSCTFDDCALSACAQDEWHDFSEFERALHHPGPWIAGIDFPFGQSRKFIETVGWPADWHGYVAHAQSLGRKGFRDALNTYRDERPSREKEHLRQTDKAVGSVSPQKLYGVPVGLMFFKGAPRLVAAGVTIPHLQDGDPERIVVEAYPGVLAREIIGRRSYKQDTKKKQNEDQLAARRDLLAALSRGVAHDHYGFKISAPDALYDDPCGDHLNSLLCVIQAAWAWRNRNNRFGAHWILLRAGLQTGRY